MGQVLLNIVEKRAEIRLLQALMVFHRRTAPRSAHLQFFIATRHAPAWKETQAILMIPKSDCTGQVDEVDEGCRDG
jgi:hypothetical protein